MMSKNKSDSRFASSLRQKIGNAFNTINDASEENNSTQDSDRRRNSNVRSYKMRKENELLPRLKSSNKNASGHKSRRTPSEDPDQYERRLGR